MEQEIIKIRKKVKKELDKERFEHTKGVAYTAGCLAMAHGCDVNQAIIAGLLHDCAKCIPNEKKLELCRKHHIPLTRVEERNPFLIHAKLGAFLAREKYQVMDPAICHAIEVHTTGAPHMNTLDKILFIADYIEPNRDKAPNLGRVREEAFHDLDRALLMILSDTLSYLGESGKEIDPTTQKTYEYYRDSKIERNRKRGTSVEGNGEDRLSRTHGKKGK